MFFQTEQSSMALIPLFFIVDVFVVVVVCFLYAEHGQFVNIFFL